MTNIITTVCIILLFVGVGFIYGHDIYGEMLVFLMAIFVILYCQIRTASWRIATYTLPLDGGGQGGGVLVIFL